MLIKQYGKGFTLVEIMIVLVILAIIAAFAIPKFSTFRLDSKIHMSTQNIAAVQRVMHYYATLNRLDPGEPLVSTSFLGTTTSHLLTAPTSPFSSGGYTYLSVVPAAGICYATETDTDNGATVNALAISNKLCQ